MHVSIHAVAVRENMDFLRIDFVLIFLKIADIVSEITSTLRKIPIFASIQAVFLGSAKLKKPCPKSLSIIELSAIVKHAIAEPVQSSQLGITIKGFAFFFLFAVFLTGASDSGVSSCKSSSSSIEGVLLRSTITLLPVTSSSEVFLESKS